MSRIRMHLKGGLGNQLFILAAGLLYADLQRVTKVVLDTRFLKSDLQRELAINGLDLPTKVVFSAGKRHSFLHKRKLSKVSNLIGRKISTEENFNMLTSTFQVQCLEGYFQNYKNVDSVRGPMISILKSIPIRQMNGKIPKNFIAVHLRRGDYLNPSTLSVHGIVSPKYVTDGVALLQRTLGMLPVVVFTDSPTIAMDELNGCNFDFFILGPEEVSATEVIVLMSSAKGLIISNSTLSWWGAWLATRQFDNKAPIVVRPAKWFAVGSEPKDLLPQEWISIEN